MNNNGKIEKKGAVDNLEQTLELPESVAPVAIRTSKVNADAIIEELVTTSHKSEINVIENFRLNLGLLFLKLGLVKPSPAERFNSRHEILVEDLNNFMISLVPRHESTLKFVMNRESYVIFQRTQNLTLESIGQEFGVTRERIRQIERKELTKLQPEKKHFEFTENLITDLERILQNNSGFISKKDLHTRIGLSTKIMNYAMGLTLFLMEETENLPFGFLTFKNHSSNINNPKEFGYRRLYRNFFALFSLKELNTSLINSIEDFMDRNFLVNSNQLEKTFGLKPDPLIYKILQSIGIIEIPDVPSEISDIAGFIIISQKGAINARNGAKAIIENHFLSVFVNNANASKEDYFNCPNGIHIKDIYSGPLYRSMQINFERYEQQKYKFIRHGSNNWGLEILNTIPKRPTKQTNNLEIMIKILEKEKILHSASFLRIIFELYPDFNINSFDTILRTYPTIFNEIGESEWVLAQTYDKESFIPSGNRLPIIKEALSKSKRPLTISEIRKTIQSMGLIIREPVIRSYLSSRNLTFKKFEPKERKSNNNFYAYETIPNPKIHNGQFSEKELHLLADYYIELLRNSLVDPSFKVPNATSISEYFCSQNLFIESNVVDSKFREISASLEVFGSQTLKNFQKSSVSENKGITKFLKKKFS
ncbi:hypothetical protein M1N55_02775 [Dehalococcoidia bacterium]|nr:hypothetical protein [Dehalococcoidia bacterium]